MERNPLQLLLGNTPDGVQGNPNHVDLGNKTWTIGDLDPNEQYPLAITDSRHDLIITGNGAQIIVTETAESVHRCGVLLRGTRIWLAGDVTIVGSRPDNHGWYEPREFDHAVCVQGAIDCRSYWKWRNVWGSGTAIQARTVYNPDGTHALRRTKNITVACPDSRQVGRQHVNIDDADHADISFQGTDCVRSALDVEIPGHRGRVNNLYYHDTDIRGHVGGPALANLGDGRAGGCQHFVVQRVRCHGTQFGVRSVPPLKNNDGTLITPSIRRTDYHILDCWSDTRTNIPVIPVWNIDGLEVKRLTQPVIGTTELVRTNDCTAVDTDCRTTQDGVLTHP